LTARVQDSGSNMIIHVDLPGVQASELQLLIDTPGVLKLVGTRKSHHEEKKHHFHHIETESGRFERTFKIPATVKGTDVQAKLDHGVLCITVPKHLDQHSSVKIH
jgi:HSP20 family protein